MTNVSILCYTSTLRPRIDEWRGTWATVHVMGERQHKDENSRCGSPSALGWRKHSQFDEGNVSTLIVRFIRDRRLK